MSSTNRLVKQLCRYIDICSTSGLEREFLLALQQEFEKRGYRVERQEVDDDRWNLLALPAGEPELVFATHIDVVPPHIPSSIREDRVYGRGACDTKGGLVAMLEAAELLDSERSWIGFLLVVSEEVDHLGAIVAADLDIRPRAIILCEPTTGNLVEGQKGLLRVKLSSRGVAGHSAFPELGRDALGPLLDSLERLRHAVYPTHPVLGDTTLNIGLLHAGVAGNVTPAEAESELVYRVVDDELKLLDQVKSLCESNVEVEVLSLNPPVQFPTVGGFPNEVIAFNTDAHYMKGLAPIYLMGPGDIRRAHGADEHIEIEELTQGVEDYVSLARALSKE